MTTFYRVVAEADGAFHGGMSAIDLPCEAAPDYRGHRGGAFWYTAKAWKSLKVSAFVRQAQAEGVVVKVKAIKVPASAVIWTNGFEAVIRKS